MEKKMDVGKDGKKVVEEEIKLQIADILKKEIKKVKK